MTASRPALTWVAIVAVALLSGALGWWVRHARDRAAEPPPPPGLVVVEPGDRLPDLSLPDLRTGKSMPLVRPGRVRVLNYWASWCGPCRDEMPALDRFATAQGDNGVEVVGIALDSRADALRFADEVAVTFPLLVEAPGPADSSVVLGNRRGLLPFSALVDADGRLLRTHYGPFPDAAAVEAWAERN